MPSLWRSAPICLRASTSDSFASLHRSMRESGTYGALMACPLATVEDIVSYYHRNNTTSQQAIASFIENVIKQFKK